MRVASIATSILFAACATTTPAEKGGPRGLRASDHLAEAGQHDELAKQTTSWPDTRSGAGPEAVHIPWVRSWDSSKDHERLATIHRSEAAALHAAFDEACGTRAASEISISPLQRYGISGSNTERGVVIYLDPKAGSPDHLLLDMRCHRAWMMLSPTKMEDCPLDLPGIQIDARGDAEGIAVSITVQDPALVGELQRRAAHDLEH